jgi:hypothetical protein
LLDARAAEVERLIESPALHGSESLCRLLRYLANRAIHEPGAVIREHEIAAEVFGRGESFDPRIDSTVRVNVARLRARLIEYYSGAGNEDPIAIELPKGSYAVVFQTRKTEAPPLPKPSKLDAPTAVPKSAAAPRTNRLLAFTLVLMTAIAAMLAATLLLDRNGRTQTPAVGAPETPAVRRFWSMLLKGQAEPWVVFSNATFVGRPATGMRYLVPSRDSGREVLDFYTGTGEVLGVHALDRTFTLLNRSMRVKRGGLLSLDDVENNDVVYVGSPLENLTLRDVPGLQDFAFKLLDSGPQSGEGALVNLSPREGEPKMFLPSTLPLTEDFAVVALVPGLNPARWALILAGTSTIGTQGAVEYVCREDTLRELLAQLPKSVSGALPLFEAVLDIQIKSGVPVRSRLVAFHLRQPKQ